MTKVTILVRELSTGAPISGAFITVDGVVQGNGTNEDGILLIENVSDGTHSFGTTVFGVSAPPSPQNITISGSEQTVELEPNLALAINITDGTGTGVSFAVDGDIVNLAIAYGSGSGTTGTSLSFDWAATAGELVQADQHRAFWHTLGAAGEQTISVTISDGNGISVTPEINFRVLRSSTGTLSGDSIPVNLGRSAVPQSRDQMLWVAIRNRTKAIAFSGSGYADFIDSVLCRETTTINGRNGQSLNRQRSELYEPIHGVGAYELLKTATQVFLLMECGTNIEEFDRYTGERLFDAEEETRRLGHTITLDEAQNRLADYLGEGRLPYINRVLDNAFQGRSINDSIFCEGIIAGRVNCPPLLELIWSYWHEEAMLVQTMNAISLRFQNRRSKGDRDPLAHLEIAPLYPLNNLLWGYIQDEVHSLSVTRRNYEYNHHYGLNLQGAAVSNFRPADPRSRFLEGFHNLLQQTTRFFKQDDDTTFLADAFPLLNSLREVHLVLSEGAHNQFGDLPWTARSEMLMQQWLLSRPELREFLQSRAMVPYRESWMAQVDTMKQMQGWTDVSVTHFNYLAAYGERILLSIRYGDWVDVTDPTLAANWARYWRPEIQNYIHSYRAATGVDLAGEAKDSRQEELRVMQPSMLLQQRLKSGKPVPTAKPNGSELPTSRFRQRRAARAASNGTD